MSILRRTIPLAVLATATFAISSAAQPAPPKPGVSPMPGQLFPPLHITAAEVHPVQPQLFGLYTQGAVRLHVTIANDGAVPIKGQKLEWSRFVAGGNTEQATATVDLPAKGSASIDLEDPDGVIDGCGRRAYSVWLKGEVGVEKRVRSVWVNPTCAFEAHLSDSMSGMVPDRAHEERMKNASMYGGKIVTPMACGKPFEVAASILNKSARTGKGVTLHLADTDGSDLGDSKPLDLPNGATTDASVTTFKHKGRIGTMKVTIADPTKSLAGKIVSQELDVRVSRVCQLHATLDP